MAARDRRVDRESRQDVRRAWMAEALQRRKRLPTLAALMRELFVDLSQRALGEAKANFDEMVKRMGSPPKS